MKTFTPQQTENEQEAEKEEFTNAKKVRDLRSVTVQMLNEKETERNGFNYHYVNSTSS